MSSGSSSRPPRRREGDRSSSRSPGPRSGKPTTGRSSDGSSSRRPSSRPGAKGRPPAGRSGGSGARGKAPRKPQTEAERRAQEVKARRAPRQPRDPDLERQRIESRETEDWVDEGSVRKAASGAVRRAGAPAEAPSRRPPRPLDPEVSTELVDALGKQRGARLAERLAQASEALDRERFQEAGRIAAAIAKEAPSVAAAHEIVGLANYRLGRYKQAAKALEVAQDLHAEPALLPVIADCYRAQRRWSAVDRVWNEIKAASPNHEVMAEGRIVAAGALADRGDLRGAIEVMEPATKRARSVRDLNLRQWYVLGDLYDRVGDPITARRWFATVADHDADFADVEHRLRTLG